MGHETGQTEQAGRRWSPRMALGALAVTLALLACAAPGQTGQSGPQTAAPTLTPTPNLTLASYAGSWTVHDDQMTITATGAGTETWNAGPCSQASDTGGLCEGTGAVTFQANPDGSLTGTYGTVSYQSSTGQLPTGFQPPAGYPQTGDTITIKHNGPHLLSASFQTSNWNYCDAYALGAGWTQCGA